ncbi:response regulator transcription factor [Sediminibacterium ginsengisoli]|uniref:Helix-turn-helix domain-containing protein n=1 Tax=Sediminibacterium ginsengisoli TaxID=413434 RepID=A0A1T4N7A5_9BACT|nr:response regulator transcription factor [Sediminibacterium ginsengisoli]SJZ75139.1 Helix-turn-helix domain-containing protein [Sediminibacterium ginsengisoli]
MKFDKYLPADRLKPYIRYFVVSENESLQSYKVFPEPGLVLGFQYSGQLCVIGNTEEYKLSSAGITGITDTYKNFKSSAGIGTILVYFTETGFARFSSLPVHELFNLSVSLHDIFDKSMIAATEEKLAFAITDRQRLDIVAHFLLSQLKNTGEDQLVTEAARLITESKGSIRIKELHQRLFISQSPLEKRFRKIVGTSPKKFASIIRFNTVLNKLGNPESLTDTGYENNYFDQAHFIKDFKQYTGTTPEKFRRGL